MIIICQLYFSNTLVSPVPSAFVPLRLEREKKSVLGFLASTQPTYN